MTFSPELAAEQLEAPFYTDGDAIALLDSIQASIVNGILPPLANGFSFVLDRRPVGQENRYIPARPYTRYFSQRQIPIAAPDHFLHGHDIRHVRSYQNAFRLTPFADLVQEAATWALQEGEHQSFATTINEFGDSMRNLEYRFHSYYPADAAGIALRSLVTLGTRRAEDEQQRFDKLWRGLCLDRYVRDGEVARTRLQSDSAQGLLD